jgi:hypothetical protein
MATRNGTIGNNTLSGSGASWESKLGYYSIDRAGMSIAIQPTLLEMGEDGIAYLLYAVFWPEWLTKVYEAKKLARQHDALLVLVLYGEVSLTEMKSLVLELAEAQVIPLWLGGENQRKFNLAIAMHRSVDQR